MSFTVIIPSKTFTNLIPCVDAIRQHEPDRPEIIVVDDGIDDPCVLEPPLRYCRWVDGEKPFVFARNVNIGIRATGSNDVILLNDDALLQTPGGFSALAKAAEERPEYGVIASTCNNVGNRAQWPQGKGLREEPRMVCFVCVYIPRSTIDRVGLLDEEFVGYGFEDDSYCLRVRRAGLKIGIHDGCFVDHGSLRSTFRGDPKAPADMRQNAAIFKKKWGVDNFGRA